ncbi:hypothetical protein ACLOJK_029135 [Asimina triloba]
MRQRRRQRTGQPRRQDPSQASSMRGTGAVEQRQREQIWEADGEASSSSSTTGAARHEPITMAAAWWRTLAASSSLTTSTGGGQI